MDGSHPPVWRHAHHVFDVHLGGPLCKGLEATEGAGVVTVSERRKEASDHLADPDCTLYPLLGRRTRCCGQRGAGVLVRTAPGRMRQERHFTDHPLVPRYGVHQDRSHHALQLGRPLDALPPVLTGFAAIIVQLTLAQRCAKVRILSGLLGLPGLRSGRSSATITLG